jgi:CRISPR-associated protein Csb3
MTQIMLGGCEPRTLLSHLALYGLGAILEAEGVQDVRLGWTRTGNPRPLLSAIEIDEMGLATRVWDHARKLNSEGSWPLRDITLKGTPRGLMSPRLTPFGSDEVTWARVQESRQAVLDELTVAHRWPDLRFLAALGEPCYWSFNKKGDPLQDDGASRLEMQPRNQGSEFVGNRLRKLANSVAQRQPQEILAGLRGESVVDEIGNNKPDSRTPTGLASPGPTDNALAWCALWGISQFPIAMRVNKTAQTSGHFSYSRNEWFYVPMWRGQWRLARLRTILASEPLRILAGSGVRKTDATTDDPQVPMAQAWLSSRGIDGVIRFPVQRFGSDNAPERRAMRGEPIPARVQS